MPNQPNRSGFSASASPAPVPGAPPARSSRGFCAPTGIKSLAGMGVSHCTSGRSGVRSGRDTPRENPRNCCNSSGVWFDPYQADESMSQTLTSYPDVRVFEHPREGASQVAVVRTTATNSRFRENLPSGTPPTGSDLWRSNPLLNPLPEIMCDWLSGSHVFREPRPPLESGRIMKISPDGEIEWETVSWASVRCSSSDTSLRFKCDGQKLLFSGNVGRFQEPDNVLGLTVPECVRKLRVVLARYGVVDSEIGRTFRMPRSAESPEGETCLLYTSPSPRD